MGFFAPGPLRYSRGALTCSSARRALWIEHEYVDYRRLFWTARVNVVDPPLLLRQY